MTNKEEFERWVGNEYYDVRERVLLYTAWRAARRWIPVSERLPDKSGGYLIFNCGCENAYFDFKDGSWETETMFNVEPTHWQPLPPPPEE
jgi:hypothetical protein